MVVVVVVGVEMGVGMVLVWWAGWKHHGVHRVVLLQVAGTGSLGQVVLGIGTFLINSKVGGREGRRYCLVG